ncbi:MAG TPA: hypothetical protein ENJ93_02855 [Chloroflexi bacterium]|nr:hypothetical protein [Chloroflexota bacterium]
MGAATQGLEAEVIAAHRLLQTAVAAQDSELISASFFPNAAWQQTQAELRQRSLFWNRASLGLWLDTTQFDPDGAADTAVAFSPDLSQAILTYNLPYATEDAAGNLTRFPLQGTAVYRQVNDAWLQAPYPADFWGDTVRYDLDNFSLLAPERDEEIGRRLAQDLRQIFGALCQLDGLTCPPDFQVELQLSREPDSLLALNQDYRARTRYSSEDGRVFVMILPTPTLVGRPLDEAGYQALYRGYAAQMAARLIASIDSDCCFLGLSQSSALVLYLRDLGLQPPRAPEYQPYELAAPPPIPLPQQDIVALCRDDAFAILRYDGDTAVWQQEFASQDGYILQMMGLGGEGILTVVSPLEDEFEVTLWWVRQGQAVPLLFADDLPRYLLDVRPFSDEADGRYVLFFNTDTAFAENGLDWALLDEANCDDTGCPLTPLERWPQFSPDGRYSLVWQYQPDGTSRWSLGDGAGNPTQPLPDVFSIVWLDGEAFAYVAAGEPLPKLRVVRVGVDGRVAETKEINLEAVLDAAASESETEWYVQTILSDPQQPDYLYALLQDSLYFYPDTPGVSPSLVVRYDWQEDTAVRLPVSGEKELVGVNDMQVNGRYLTLSGLDGARSVLYLYDLDTAQAIEYDLSAPHTPTGWSADGQWLLIPQGTSLRLVAPSIGYEKQIFHDLTACDTAVWVESP